MVKVYKEIEQNSEEWHNLRKGIPTASTMKKLITTKGERSKSATEYLYKIAAGIIMEKTEESYKSNAMIRGSDLEDEARQEYEKEMLCTVEQVGFMRNKYAGYSPDGLVGDDGLIEIKCPENPGIHLSYMLEGKVPTEYKLQCQTGLYVSERSWIDFVSYHPCFIKEKRLFITREHRDDELISQMIYKLKKFKSEINQILKRVGIDGKRG